MDYDQELIDRLQANLFRDKLRNVDASKLEEAVQRMARNKTATQKTGDAPAQHDGKDKQVSKTGIFRFEDLHDEST